jgi:aryl-alcohol dehydrogenase-like predicted oxidoreductase
VEHTRLGATGLQVSGGAARRRARAKEAVTAPIVGATKPGQVEDAVAALAVGLTDDEIAALEAPYVPHPILGH